MCGISGFVAFDTQIDDAVIQKVLERFNRHLEHRGPDASGVWLSEGKSVGLAHTRLSILDLAPGANQPMITADNRFALTFNGEIYNYLEIKKFLTNRFGATFRTQSDTEVVLQGCVHLGVAAFADIAEGMFAFAFYDAKRKTVTLARDRAGEKPLYFLQSGELFAFASELKPLIELTECPQVNPAALYLYLILRYVPDPYTMVQGIHKVGPGELVTFDIEAQTPTRSSYFSWDPDPAQIIPSQKSFQETVQKTSDFLTNSLKNCLRSDVPLGFFLSGGIDSSLCAAIGKKLGAEITSFTVRFEGDDHSEADTAKQTAKVLGINHHERLVSTQELYERSWQILKSVDEPNGDRSCIPTFLLAEFARSHVKTVIGGDGGDELFGGYTRYRPLSRLLALVDSGMGLRALESYLTGPLAVFGIPNTDTIFSTRPPAAGEYLINKALHFAGGFDGAESVRYLDFCTYLPGAVLGKVDRMSMLSSLEVRTPFFNSNILKLASQLPREFLYGKLDKPVLRRLCGAYGMNYLEHLPKKGFGMPPKFLLSDKAKFIKEVNDAIDKIKHSPLINGSLQLDMSSFATFALSNTNAAWSTIALGYWLESIKG
jgi:asparagine synthase (glutamine-hydrolysing)